MSRLRRSLLFVPASSERFFTSRVVTLFARDAAVRRTALASAIGLAATACIFFRSGPLSRLLWRRKSRRRLFRPKPATMDDRQSSAVLSFLAAIR